MLRARDGQRRGISSDGGRRKPRRELLNGVPPLRSNIPNQVDQVTNGIAKLLKFSRFPLARDARTASGKEFMSPEECNDALALLQQVRNHKKFSSFPSTRLLDTSLPMLTAGGWACVFKMSKRVDFTLLSAPRQKLSLCHPFQSSVRYRHT